MVFSTCVKLGISGQLQIAILHPAGLAAELVDKGAQNGGEDEGDQDQARPVKSSGIHGDGAVGQSLFTGSHPTGPHAQLAAQAAGAHTGVDGRAVHLQTEQAGGNGAGNGGGDGRGDPDAGVFHDVRHLQHGGAEALTHQTAPAVLPKAHNGEAHHLGAADTSPP